MHARLEAICGPMFAGKTTELIRRLVEARSSACDAVAIKPALDTRYAMHELVTHAGARLRARAVVDADEIAAAVGAATVIGVDEAHFFGAPLTAVCRALAASGRRVIVAGLEFDHFGETFEPFPSLLRCADEVTRLVTACARCGAPATHTQRLIASEARIAVGGAGDYEARCAACFRPSVRGPESYRPA